MPDEKAIPPELISKTKTGSAAEARRAEADEVQNRPDHTSTTKERSTTESNQH